MFHIVESCPVTKLNEDAVSWLSSYAYAYEKKKSHQPIFASLAEMTDTNKLMNPLQFGSDPANIGIQLRINPEIHIQILDQFWLKLDALLEVCDLWTQPSRFYTVFIHSFLY